MPETSFAPPPVEVIRPDTLAGPEVIGTEIVRPSCYFEGISKPERDKSALLLKTDTDRWLNQFTGLKEGARLFESPTTQGKKENNGVPYSSIRIADQINTGKFSHENMMKKVGNLKEGIEVMPLAEADYDLLIETAPNKGLAIYVRMLRDIEYPQDYSNLPQLTPRPADLARDIKFLGDYDDMQSGKGAFCGEAEGNFMADTKRLGALKLIKLGGDIIAWQKTSGEHTALLTKDAVLNGVKLPKGSLLTVDYDDSGSPRFSFARLTAFTVSSPQEIESMAPYLSSNNIFTKNSNGYENIRALLDQESQVTVGDVLNSLVEIEQYFIDDAEARKIANILKLKEANITNYQNDFNSRMQLATHEVFEKYTMDITNLQTDSPEIRKAKNEHFAERTAEVNKVTARSKSSLNPLVAFENSLNNLERMFGAQKVKEVRRVMRDRDIAERTLRAMNKVD